MESMTYIAQNGKVAANLDSSGCSLTLGRRGRIELTHILEWPPRTSSTGETRKTGESSWIGSSG
jgi:hypothetical protein